MYHDLQKEHLTPLLCICPADDGRKSLQQFYNIADTLIVGRVLGKMLWRRWDLPTR